MKDIEELIVGKLPEYSKNQKKLANFFLENLQTLPLLSVNQVAEKASISTASVVRFVRLLGFRGYLEFRNQLANMLKEHLSPVERYRRTLEHKEEYYNNLEKVANQVINNIHYSINQNKLEEFKHIVTHISQAETIYCIGLGISHYLAHIMAYLLKLYMKKAFSLSNDTSTFPEQIMMIKPKDLLITFSFPPYSRPTIEAAQMAHEQGVPVISFTDKRTSPVVEFSDHLLLAKTDNILFTNSLGTISILMNALITELAFADEESVLRGLKEIEKYMKDDRYYY